MYFFRGDGKEGEDLEFLSFFFAEKVSIIDVVVGFVFSADVEESVDDGDEGIGADEELGECFEVFGVGVAVFFDVFVMDHGC